MFRVISIDTEFPKIEHTRFSGDISLTDYDIVIIDPSDVIASFPEHKIDSRNRKFIDGQRAHHVLEIVERRRSEISALLNKGRLIISFLDPLFEVTLASQGFSSNAVQINNYSWLPNENNKKFVNHLIKGTGTGLQLIQKSHAFSPYYSAFQKELNFSAYIDISVSEFYLGNAFISNSADLVLGFSLNISNGLVVFLPRFKVNEENNRKFIGVLLQIAQNLYGADAKTPPPDWANVFTIPGTDILEKSIRHFDERISDLETQKAKIIMERKELNEFKFLLYEQGHELERKSLDAFRLMGFKAETISGENTDFDVILEADEGRAIAEIEGKDDGSIHKGKIDQLLSAINQDAEKTGVFAKGVLIGNHFRLKPIEGRGEPFTETVVRLAKQYHYALVTTIELYRAVVYLLGHPEDDNFKKACRKAILDSDGTIVDFTIPDETPNNE